MTKKLKPLTLPTSGETVQTVPISQVALTLQIKRERPEPKAPLVTVEIAGTPTVERNHADPDYLQALKTWENLIQVEVTDRILKRIAVKQVLTDEQKAEVAELREALSDEALPESDKLLWLMEIAIGDDKDLEALIKFVSGMADPDNERVTQNANNFRR